MNVKVEWFNEDRTIIHAVIQGNWTWDEAQFATEEIGRLLDEVSHPVCVIGEITASNWMPNQAMAKIAQLMRYYATQDHLRGIYIVESGRIVSTLFGAVMRVAGNRLPDVTVKFVPSFEEAQRIVAEVLNQATK